MRARERERLRRRDGGVEHLVVSIAVERLSTRLGLAHQHAVGIIEVRRRLATHRDTHQPVFHVSGLGIDDAALHHSTCCKQTYVSWDCA